MRTNVRHTLRDSGSALPAPAGTIPDRAAAFARGTVAAVGRSSGWSAAIASTVVALVCSNTLAAPEGARVVRGDVSITRDGSNTLIRAGRNSIINYRGFDIAANESVRFIQPDAASRVLNRIQSAAPTRIDGALSANGRVYLVNPAGVVFGQGARVNVGGLYAAAGNLADADFVRGVDRFTSLAGAVENRGTLTADFVALLGGSVANAGSIVAPQGTVVMAAGSEALVGPRDGNVFVRVTGAATPAAGAPAVDNRGTITARAGRVVLGAGDVYSMAIRTTGPVVAKDIKVEGQGRGIVSVEGRLDASGASNARRTGGTVEVTGQKVGLFGAAVDASGPAAGGTVRVGGDYQGKGALRRAEVTVVGEGTTLRADATARGDGGAVIVWSDETTRFYGAASARGGPAGGDGGLIETSSKGALDVRAPGRIDASAPRGANGTWLLDPRNVTIAASATTAGAYSGGDPETFAPDDTGDAVADVATITAALDAGVDVIVTTQASPTDTGADAGDITIDADILKTAGDAATLTLNAANDITLNAGRSITSTSDALNLVFNANDALQPGGSGGTGAGGVTIAGSINTNGGSFTSTGVAYSQTGSIIAPGGQVLITHTGAASIVGPGIFSGTADLTVTASGLTLNAPLLTGGGAIEINAPITLAGASFINTTDAAPAGGSITLVSAVDGGFDLTLNAGTDGTIGLGGSVGAGTRLGLLTITNAGDVIAQSIAVTALTQVAGSGTTGLNGPLDAAGNISLTGNAFTLASVTTTAGGTVTIDNAADLTLFGPLALDGAFSQIGAGAAILNASLTTTADAVSFASPLTLSGSITTGGLDLTVGAVTLTGVSTLDAGTGVLTIGDVINTGSSALTLTADEIQVDAVITGSGALTLQPFAAAIPIILGGADADGGASFTLSSDELARLADGHASITIGRADGTHAFTTASELIFNDPVTLRAPAAGGSFAVTNTLRGLGNASITLAAPATPGLATTTLSADIVTAGAPIIITGDVVLAADIALETTAGGTVLDGADVTVGGAIDADAAANNRALRIDGGNIGVITLGPVGAVQALGDVNASGGTLNLRAVTTTGSQGYTGLVRLDGNLTALGAGSIRVTGGLALLADTTITSPTSIVVDAPIDSADASAPRALTLDAGPGAIVVSGEIGEGARLASLATVAASGVSLQGALTTGFQIHESPTTIAGQIRGTEVRFNAPLTLDGPSLIEGTTFVVLGSSINSFAGAAHALTINSPATTLSGEIGALAGGELGSLTTDAGGSLTLGSATVRTIGDQTYGDAVTLITNVTATSTAGAVRFGSALNSDATGRTLTLIAPGSSVLAGPTGAINALAALTSDAGGTLVLGGNVTTTGAQTYADAVILGANAVLTANGITFSQAVNSDDPATPRILTLIGGPGGVTAAAAIGADLALGTLTASGATLSFASVTTTNAQTYNAPLRLAGELRTLTSGGVTVNGPLRLAANSSIRTAGRAGDAVIITGPVLSVSTPFALNVTAGSGTISFGSDVGTGGDSVTDTLLSSLSASGGGVTLRNVRTVGSQLYSGAATLTGSLTTTGPGSVAVDGALTLAADAVITTNNGQVVFGRTVDSDSIARALTINTGGGSLTRFNGAVGGVSRLSTLTTNADGSVRFAGASVRTVGDQLYNDPVVLAAVNNTFEGNDVTFASLLDSETASTPRNLTVNTAGATGDPGETAFRAAVGSVARLNRITTNADGLTRIFANVTTANGMNFGDQVRIGGNATLDGGNGNLLFRLALDADAEATDPRLTLLSNAPADLERFPFGFGASIGRTRRLGALTLGADRAGLQSSTIVFSDGLQSDGRILASSFSPTDVFEVITGAGGLSMGRGQRLTAFGSIRLQSAGRIALGDLTALTNIDVVAPEIVLRTRAAGRVLDNVFQNPDETLEDRGLDIVANSRIAFSTAPTRDGSGAVTFSNVSGGGGATLTAFPFRQFSEGVSISLFTDPRDSSRLLARDLRAQGPSATNIATSLAGAIPRDVETRDLAADSQGRDSTLAADLRAPLLELGLDVRDLTPAEQAEFLVGRAVYADSPVNLVNGEWTAAQDYRITANRLSPAAARAAADEYRALTRAPAYDESGRPILNEGGTPLLVDRTGEIADTIGQAWETYSALSAAPDGQGFRAWLESRDSAATPAEAEALGYLNSIRSLLARLEALGLSEFEANIPRRKLMNEVRPAAMTEQEFTDALARTRLSLSTP